MKKIYRTKREIIGAFAKWIIRQYPHLDFQQKLLFPALREIEMALDHWEDQKSDVLGINDLRDLIESIISVCPAVKEYNRNEIERNGGQETGGYVFTDRYSTIKPEYDFIDIDALKRNVIGELSSDE